MFHTTRPSVASAVALSVASFSTLQSLLVPVLPMLQADLHTTPEATTWTLTAWLITAATPVLGRVGDLAGKRRTMLIALVALSAASSPPSPRRSASSSAPANSRASGGAIFPLACGILRDSLPAERVPSAIGATSAVLAIGGGIVLAGPLSLVVGWRGLFLVPIVLVVVGAALVVVGSPSPVDAPRAGSASPRPCCCRRASSPSCSRSAPARAGDGPLPAPSACSSSRSCSWSSGCATRPAPTARSSTCP